LAKAPRRVGVTQALYCIAGDFFKVNLGRGFNLAKQANLVGAGHGLDAAVRLGVFGQRRVDNGVANSIADFVGMAGAHRFAGKQPSIFGH
jgi:hypothetical protein